ncbi:MAG: DUF3494 domain-containing protein [Chloroflexi bacterium]|nr:DUF3494 domain-containing protein [Chloroflexota bacterium]MBU1879710.1 DUF3494 domain-containing protein [Chloroflexota bacterium]
MAHKLIATSAMGIGVILVVVVMAAWQVASAAAGFTPAPSAIPPTATYWLADVDTQGHETFHTSSINANVVPSLNAVPPNLGSAASFVGLAYSTLTNTGPGVFVGDVGVSPGTSVVGFPPGTVRRGTIYTSGPVPAQAQIDATTAYNALEGQTCNVHLTGQDLGGMTLTPGVYCFDTSAQLTGILTLDALDNPNAVWVFQTGSTLTTASSSSVKLINGGQAVNVFWQIGSSATLGTGTRFNGNILADASITLNTGASLIGRALSLNGGVTMNTNDTPFPITNTPLFEFYYLPIIMR